MRATFLEAEVPLTKTFFVKDGQIEKQGHPRIVDYTSHEEKFETIEELHAHLVAHAAKGHCFLKGNVVRPLVKEPRVGTHDPNEETSVLLLDFDGLKGGDSVNDILTHLKLGGADYIVQYSSSMGVLPARGLSAHVFMLLERPLAPAILKQYLMQWNLNVPLLKSNLGLTRTYNALRWSLDITTCQNDKLIYIAPPLLRDGVVDSFVGDRIALVPGKSRRLSLPDPFPNAETNKEQAQEVLNEKRKAMGLKERPKTSMKVKGSVEYMARPDEAVVTGVRESNGFVHLNLNGGDSWGYYHPADNPEFIYNFKNEPVYKTSELLPHYWAEVKGKMNEVRPTADGKVYLAFRDFRTALYYNGVYDVKADRIELAVAKSEKQLHDFLRQHEQPVPEYVSDWTVKFDPHMGRVADVEARVVNTYQPSPIMRLKPRRVTTVPPTISKVLFHALGSDEEAVEHWLNWFACIVQYKERTGTSWVFHGVPGTGKGLMLDRVIRPILGLDYVVSKRMRELDSQFNGYMEQTFVLWIDEAEQSDFREKGLVNADIKNFITEPRISIRKMHTLPYEATNYLNWILASNKGHVIEIDPGDRRFNVAVYQPERLAITTAEVDQLGEELPDFYSYLMTRKADRDVARTVLNNPAKQKMALLNRKAVDVASDAILAGDLEHFWHQLPQGGLDGVPAFERERAERYAKLLHDIVDAEKTPRNLLREELFTLLQYTVGGMPETPAKFSAFLKHHGLDIGSVTRDGKTMRGVHVKWKIKPEWRRKEPA